MALKKIPPIPVDWDAIQKELAPHLAHEPELVQRFTQIPARHPELQAATLAQVVEWEYYTFPAYEIDPSYYLLDRYPPGRRIKTDPGPEASVVRYGINAGGRKVIMRWPNNANIREKLWEYHPDRIDVMDVVLSKKSDPVWPSAVQSLFLKDGKPAGFFEYSKRGRYANRLRYKDGNLIEVLAAHVNPDFVAIGVPGDRWVYSFADINYDESGDAHVRIFPSYQNTGYSQVRKLPGRIPAKVKVPILDLRKDITDTRAAIQKAVAKFAARQAKSGKAVSGIGLGYFVFENPEIFIQFDTRPEFKPDGVWSDPEFSRLKRARWNKFLESCGENDGKGVVIDTQGARHEFSNITEEKRLAGWLGDAMVASLKSACDSGVFDSIKKAPRCELSVEEAGDGEYGWPRYADRGKDNLVK